MLVERLERFRQQAQEGQAGRQEIERLNRELIGIKAARDADAERLAWIHTADEQLRTSFQVLAGEVLQESSRGLMDRSGEQLRLSLEPIERALSAFGSQVQEIEKDRRGAYDGLKREIALLRAAHGSLQATTFSLQQALKSSGVRGRWGEIQLRRVVEMAGLVEHVDFAEQPTVGGLRPDLVVHLPQGGILPVDAKAPMAAFLEAAEAKDDSARRSHLEDHLKAMRQRTVELGQRQYWKQFESAPELVVMFVPNEACLGSAFERDPDFLEFALAHRVLPATPVTLLALLKSVTFGWRQHQVARDSRKIALAGRELHDRLARFLDHLRRMGKSLEGSMESYNLAVGSLERRVLPAARRLEELGASADHVTEVEALSGRVRPPRGGRDDGVDRASSAGLQPGHRGTK